MDTPDRLAADPPPILALTRVEAAYDDIILALRGVSLTVPEGAVVALLGANGAGKSTTLKAASGLLAAERGAITAGEVRFRGQSLAGVSPGARVRGGLAHVLEGRHCFPHLTVEENLLAGGLAHRASRARRRGDLERIYHDFPRLTRVRRVRAGYTSGGEQQMVALGRALMSRPSLVLLDEPSMGLAPQVVEEIFTIVRTLNREHRVSFLLAEQNARAALRFADHGYIIENGRVAASGTAAELSARTDVQAFYLGVGSAGSGIARHKLRRARRSPVIERDDAAGAAPHP